MSLIDTMTDTDILSLRRKNEILRSTLEAQGILNTKLKDMLDVAIGRLLSPSIDDEYVEAEMRQHLFRDFENKVGKSADKTPPGESEATADESGQLDG